MNINKFTQNSLQAVQACEKLAYDYGNQELVQEHLLYALVTQDDSLILKLLEKIQRAWSPFPAPISVTGRMHGEGFVRIGLRSFRCV